MLFISSGALPQVSLFVSNFQFVVSPLVEVDTRNSREMTEKAAEIHAIYMYIWILLIITTHLFGYPISLGSTAGGARCQPVRVFSTLPQIKERS